MLLINRWRLIKHRMLFTVKLPEKYTGTLLHAIGSEFGINGNRDSAYFYLEKALNLLVSGMILWK